MRYKASFWAALNQAFDDGKISDDSAWRKAKFDRAKKGRKSRDVILADEQIVSLFEKTEKSFQDLCRGILLIGLRPGIEIEHIRCEQCKINGRLEILKSKTGPRIVLLSDDANRFIEDLVKDKNPTRFMFARDDGRRWSEKEASRTMAEIRGKARRPETVRARYCVQSRSYQKLSMVYAIMAGDSVSPVITVRSSFHDLRSR